MESRNAESGKVRVVIVGGGTAGWLAAAALSRQLAPLLDITLVESDAIGTVGVGEATIPTMRSFHRLAGVDEQEFMRRTHATFKLGIEFQNWGQRGDRYIHSFGSLGKSNWMCDFHHIWLEGRARELSDSLDEYCFELQAARQEKFGLLENVPINYAYHLDAGLYAKYLRELSEARGVRRVEGTVEEIERDTSTGDLSSIRLGSGARVPGDFFVDCTGFRGLLIEQELKAGFEDWGQWLSTDRAIAVQTAVTEAPVPYTRSIALEAGWRWQIPLQNRVGNGLVYCSAFMSDDEALESLMGSIGDPLTEPRVIRFQTGCRKQAWKRNCVALGLASGFVEPLESTSIHLIMSGITHLIRLFPFNGCQRAAADRYNALFLEEMENVRDFIVLHYKQTGRQDSDFWRHCQAMSVPDSLADRIELFRQSAQAYQAGQELFRVDSWVQVMLGQGLETEEHHRMAAMMSDEQLAQSLAALKSSISRAVARLPQHNEFVRRYCQQ